MADQLATLLMEGLEHHRYGRVREAIAAWQEVLRIDPGNRRARAFLEGALSGRFVLGSEPEHREAAAEPVAATLTDLAPVTDLPEATQPRPPPGPGAADRPAASAETLSPEDSERLLARAQHLLDLNDFSGALEVAERIATGIPGHPEAEALRSLCTRQLLEMYESRIGPLSGVPRVAVKPDEVVWLHLDHRAGFLLAQVDGRVSFDDLFAISGMSQLETARLLAQMLDEKIIVAAAAA